MGQVAIGGPFAAQDELALAAPDVDVRGDLVRGAGVDERPDIGRGGQAVAQGQRPGPRLQPLQQRRQHRPIDDDPRGRRAALAGRAEGAPQDAVGGQVQVRVVQHDHAVLAAELQAQALELGPGLGRQVLAGRRRAGERDDRDVGRIDDGVADLTAGAGHEVDDTGREAGLGHELDDERGAVRRVARRLEDHGVAGDQGGHHLPARDGHREVPGGDDAGHADRLADGHRPLVGQLAGHGVAEHPPALAGHQVRDVDAFLDVAAGLGQDLAHLAGHRPGQALLVLGHELGEGVQDLAALGGRGAPPHRAARSRPP